MQPPFVRLHKPTQPIRITARPLGTLPTNALVVSLQRLEIA